jgi:hypothetical protein
MNQGLFQFELKPVFEGDKQGYWTLSSYTRDFAPTDFSEHFVIRDDGDYVTWAMSETPGDMPDFASDIAQIYICATGSYVINLLGGSSRGELAPYDFKGRVITPLPIPDFFRLDRERRFLGNGDDVRACRSVAEAIKTYHALSPSSITSRERYQLQVRAAIGMSQLGMFAGLINYAQPMTMRENGLQWLLAATNRVHPVTRSGMDVLLLTVLLLSLGSAFVSASESLNKRNQKTLVKAVSLYEGIMTTRLNHAAILRELQLGCEIYNRQYPGARVVAPTSLSHDSRFILVDTRSHKMAPDTLEGLSLPRIVAFAASLHVPNTRSTHAAVLHIIFEHFNKAIARQDIQDYMEFQLGSIHYEAVIALFNVAIYATTNVAYACACFQWGLMSLAAKPLSIKVTQHAGSAYLGLVDMLTAINELGWEPRGANFWRVAGGVRVNPEAIAAELKLQGYNIDTLLELTAGAARELAGLLELRVRRDSKRGAPVIIADPNHIFKVRVILEQIDRLITEKHYELGCTVRSVFLNTLERTMFLLPSERQGWNKNPGFQDATTGEITLAKYQAVMDLKVTDATMLEMNKMYAENVFAGFVDPSYLQIGSAVVAMAITNQPQIFYDSAMASIATLTNGTRYDVELVNITGATFGDVVQQWNTTLHALAAPVHASVPRWTLGGQVLGLSIIILYSSHAKMRRGLSSSQMAMAYLTGMVVIPGAYALNDFALMQLQAQLVTKVAPDMMPLVIGVASAAMTGTIAAGTYIWGSTYLGFRLLGMATAFIFGVPYVQNAAGALFGAPKSESLELQVHAICVVARGRRWVLMLALACSPQVAERFRHVAKVTWAGKLWNLLFDLDMHAQLESAPVVMFTPFDHARNYLLEPLTLSQFAEGLQSAATQVIIDATQKPIGSERLHILVHASWNFRRLLQGLLCETSAFEGFVKRLKSGKAWSLKERDEWVQRVGEDYPYLEV